MNEILPTAYGLCSAWYPVYLVYMVSKRLVVSTFKVSPLCKAPEMRKAALKETEGRKEEPPGILSHLSDAVTSV